MYLTLVVVMVPLVLVIGVWVLACWVSSSQVVAVDSDSNYPATAPKTDLSAYKPNVEAIAKYKPDLVVLSDDIDNIKAQLTKLSIPVLVEPAAASLDDAYEQIESLGARFVVRDDLANGRQDVVHRRVVIRTHGLLPESAPQSPIQRDPTSL